MTNKTHRTATCKLLANVALVGAAVAVPMTAAVPVMAVTTPMPGVVQADRAWDGGDDGSGRGGDWGNGGWANGGWANGDWGSGDWGSGDLFGSS
ncbi:hypothetical protein ACIRRA_23030 [Nocardia sp. NPDC101769]|uniref:hypothetical protein n=1 Tax=Nocardia sp. NPDC101769 TaxID=3364333 RepID=UPI0038223D59